MHTQEPEFTSDPAKYSDWATPCPSDPINVGTLERWASVAGGTLLALYGLRRAPFSTLMLLMGSGLAYRGLTGHCHVYEATSLNTAPPKAPIEPKIIAMKPKSSDIVNEASWESFPASDPPSFSGGYT